MKSIKVDISDLQVSNGPESVLVTYALGSCIALILYDPKRKTGGMIHYMLPQSKTDPEKAKSTPGMFADTGIPLLFDKMAALGSLPTDLIAKVAGGGKFFASTSTLDIGKRNYTIVRKMLWKKNIMIQAEDVGGKKSRTTRLFLSSGKVTVSSGGEEKEL
jgi:chemotaxis protein CheD